MSYPTLLPGYEHDIEDGAGLSISPGHPHVVLHTTESPRGSFAQIRNLWRGSNNWGKGLPHFLADGTRYVQLLPLDVAAYTLENHPGGTDTNRAGPAIQVEICGRSQAGLADDEYDALGKWLADLVRAGVPLDLSQHPQFYGEGAGFTLASYTSPIRFDTTNFTGFCGHQHVLENAHWDPGALDADRIEHIARTYLSPTPEEPIAMNFIVNDARVQPYGKVWLVSGLTKRALTNNPIDYPKIFVDAAKSGTLHDFRDYGLQSHGSPVIAWLDWCKEV